jgi:tetrapyrrole methylase family protein/MazG family protein
MVPEAACRALAGAARCFFRTRRHPAVSAAAHWAGVTAEYFDRHYEAAASFDDVYAAIVEDVAGGALAVGSDRGYVAYAVPGSPLVAERTVELLRQDSRVAVEVVPAPSFLDLVWDRLGVDPVAAGVRIVDGMAFAVEAAGERGPLLVAQCYSPTVLSQIKLAVDNPGGGAVLLHHLGLPDEQIVSIPWSELDRTMEPDHLTTVWVPDVVTPAAGELVRLEELVRTLRAQCPWDRRQTHGSLARHLLEEAYEALDALDEVAASEAVEGVHGERGDVPAEVVAHLEEELGDLLFQVVFHSVLASEVGRFTLADVAREVHDKLVHRHPHVFGDAPADTPEEVAARWEVLKREEKGRASIADGIPSALPALALAAKLQRKAEAVGTALPSLDERLRQLSHRLDTLASSRSGDRSGETLDAPPETVATIGELLFALADAARRLGVDPETALRAYAGSFRRLIAANE